MTVQLNHTIVHSRDKDEAARFLAEILGVAEPAPYGPFLVVQLGEVSLDFADERGPVTDRKSTRLNSSHVTTPRMPSSA